ncbi:Vacuolar protein sorting-associated protein 18 -like protein [Echinococcus granulosus]|nr:Vacuolar protein sorting-associated protein 18 -like protein [Echinococcus granulosus]
MSFLHINCLVSIGRFQGLYVMAARRVLEVTSATFGCLPLPLAHITHVVVCCNLVFAATTSNKLVIARVLDRSYVTEIEITSHSDDRVHNLFVDPHGCHIIISMQSGVNLYTTRKCKKLKQVQKAKDLLIDSVAWNQFNESDTTTQEILIGTNEGIIFEAMLSSSEEFLGSLSCTVLWKELIRLDQSITGLVVIRYPPGSALVPVGELQLCAVLASTPGRLYQFFGRMQSSDLGSACRYISATALREGYIPGFYAPVFAPYSQNLSGAKFIEFPVSYGYSDLKVFHKKGEEVPSQFAWMTASGIYFCQLDPTRLIDSEVISSASDLMTPLRISLASHAKLIPYPTMAGELASLPLCISLMEFHVVIAYADRVKAVNLLDDQPVFSQSIRDVLGGTQLSGVCRDPEEDRLWLYSSTALCQLTVDREDWRIWRIHLDRQQFKEARKYCKTSEQLDVIVSQEAEFYFAHGEYVKSAELFAETSTPFEEIALRFSQITALSAANYGDTEGGNVAAAIALTEDYEVIDEQEGRSDGEEVEDSRIPTNTASSFGMTFRLLTSCTPLKVFLRTKLKLLEGETNDRLMTVIALWLIELLLGEIGLLEDKCAKPDAPSVRYEELASVRNEFRLLVTSSKVSKILSKCKDVIYSLLSSHGNSDDFVFFAKTNGDYDRLIDHYMSRGAYAEALFVFTTHPSCAAKLYQYSAQLAPCEPKMLVDAWISAGRRLCPCRLLSSLLLLLPGEAIRYLEFALDQLQCQEQAIHHQLIHLYASLPDSTADTRLLTYLKKYTPSNLCGVFVEVLGGLGTTDNMSKTLSSAYTTLEPGLPYDPGFAIRTSMEKGCLRSTVFLLQSLGLFGQAIEEALSKNDIALAKEIVKSNILGIDAQRALWLRIARHVVTDQSSPQEATALLQESSLLRLEDVFPLFPDFVTIDEFREVICESLDAYNSQIEQLKVEMRSTVESTNEIRTQLHEYKSHYEIIPENARCSHCLHSISLRTFYVFPCGHFFHTDCLLNLVRPLLTPGDAARLAELCTKAETDAAVIQSFRSQFDELVAADCALCGKVAIDSVSRLYFSDAKEYESEQKIWLTS